MLFFELVESGNELLFDLSPLSFHFLHVRLRIRKDFRQVYWRKSLVKNREKLSMSVDNADQIRD